MSESNLFINWHKRLMAFTHGQDFVRLSRRDKLDTLCQLACDLLQVKRASVWHLSRDQLRLDLETLHIDGVGPNHDAVHLLQKEHPEYFNALLSERVIDACDAHKDARTQSFATHYLGSVGVKAMLDAPIFAHGKIFGVFCLEASERRQWSLAELAFCCTLADTVSLINTYEAWQVSQQELDYVTHYDDLTGLSNHRSLHKRIKHLISPQHSNDQPQPFALAWINIDKLKQINEGLGQEMGDLVIQLAANRLRQLPVRGKDKIARLDGNQFALIIRSTGRHENLERILEEFIDQILKPLPLPDNSHAVTMSAGLCIFPEDGLDGVTLLRHAEAAMHQAKQQGANCALFFNANISRHARAQFNLEQELRRSLDEHELEVYYQPIINSKSGSISGAEALVRWPHPRLGLLTPNDFLPLAKRAGLSQQLDTVVIHQVCRDLIALSESSFSLPKVAINLSAEMVKTPELPGIVAQLLDYYKIDGQQLEFEVIEDTVQDDSRNLLRSLQALANLGPTLSIDDFGTGYSSLSRLKHLPFHKLKIDRSFIRELPDNTQDCAIVKSIVSLAKSLDMQVVAEGVETQQQQDWLSQQRIEYMQGYAIAKPMPLDDLKIHFLAEVQSA